MFLLSIRLLWKKNRIQKLTTLIIKCTKLLVREVFYQLSSVFYLPGESKARSRAGTEVICSPLRMYFIAFKISFSKALYFGHFFYVWLIYCIFQALYPELYLLPRVECFEDVYPLSSSTQQRHHFNAETNRYGHGSRLPNLPQQKTESKQFLESVQSSHQLENQKVYSPAEWSEKESLPVLHTSHEQDHNRITETQTQFRVKGTFNQCSEEE